MINLDVFPSQITFECERCGDLVIWEPSVMPTLTPPPDLVLGEE